MSHHCGKCFKNMALKVSDVIPSSLTTFKVALFHQPNACIDETVTAKNPVKWLFGYSKY